MKRLFHFLGCLAYWFQRGKDGHPWVEQDPTEHFLYDGISFDRLNRWFVNRGGVKITVEFMNAISEERMDQFVSGIHG
jgi:hypothetical protein